MLSLFTTKNNPPLPGRRSRRPSYRPGLEALEDRCVPSAAGALDPTFGNGAGYVTTSLSTSSDIATSVLVQPDGKILATGKAGSSTSPALVRYNSDGSLDGTFGTGGVASVPTGLNAAAAIYPIAGSANDGKIVLPGPGSGAHVPPASAPNTFSVVRLNANGSLDTSFGSNGTATVTFPAKSGGLKLGSSGVSRVLIQPDGKIVGIGVSADIQTVELARFNADGSVDTTFGQGGLVYTSLGTQQIGAMNVLREPNGDLVAAMTASTGTTLHIELIGYHANGGLNSSFGSGGIVDSPPFHNSHSTMWDAAVYPGAGTANDGKIVVVGYDFITFPGQSDLMLARYNPNGALDSTFGVGGVVDADFGRSSSAVAIQPDGKLVVTGGSRSVSAITRFNADGSPDSTFGVGGVVPVPLASVTSQADVALQPDGNIVVVGNAVDGAKGNYTSIAVLRYLGHATGPSFAITGPSTVTAGTAGTFTLTVQNADGTADTGYSGTVHITSSDPQAVLPADFTITGGSATFSATLETAGIQSLTVTDPANPTYTGQQGNIQVSPAAAARLILNGPSSIAKGTAFTLTVTVQDDFGNVVTDYGGTVKFISSDGNAVLPSNYTFSATDAGVHTFTNPKLKTKGKQTITVMNITQGTILGTLTITVT